MRRFRRFLLRFVALIAVIAASGCNSRSHASQPEDVPHGGGMQPYAGKLPPDDGQWTMPAKDYGAYRYSQLNQINTGNAKDLKLAFTFSTGTLNGLEAAPLVVNNTMYVITSFPNFLYAPDPPRPARPIKGCTTRSRWHQRRGSPVVTSSIVA